MRNYLVLGLLLTLLTACSTEKKDGPYQNQDKKIADLQKELEIANKNRDLERQAYLEKQMHEKRKAKSLVSSNTMIFKNLMDGHTSLYSFEGSYKILVIPVQFSDTNFDNPGFYATKLGETSAATDYLFGNNPNSMTTYYKHQSYGKFHLSGEVAPIVTVDKPLVEYGEAVSGANDINARALVVDALQKIKDMGANDQWWESFDNWDLNDYDNDQHFYEPDGFIDAVVLVFAGKAQSNCQRSFDPNGDRPASADVPPGPRQAAAVECFNRIWPHRWSIALSPTDPRYSRVGPNVEGVLRPSMNGFKLTDKVFALDYNMQAEYSALSTLIHEFGHSLSLPDIYAYSGDNNTGAWEVMSSTSTLKPQEMSTFSKMSLGWLKPKVIEQGKTTSAYLGSINYVTNLQREEEELYTGPVSVKENFKDKIHDYSVISTVPDFGEPVYRSIAVLTDPSKEEERIIEPIPEAGAYTAYSGRFDGSSKSIKINLTIPENATSKTLSFDTIYHIETETNFNSNEENIRVVTDYDIGGVYINGELKEELRIISGDTNNNTLADLNAACNEANVLSLRLKKIQGTITEQEAENLKTETAVCQKPIWIKKTYDLSAYSGEVELEVRYVTDAGYTEFGIFVDNITLADTKIDFENQPNIKGGFTLIKDGVKINQFNQFYLMEYRDPTDTFSNESLNYDQNIHMGQKQSFFFESEDSLVNRFRMVEMNFQPGVLVWYYNAKFDRRSNTPEKNDGKGYLLVVNPKVRELMLPGSLSKPELLDADGDYLGEGNAVYKTFEKEQREEFGCFAHSQYYNYIEGSLPLCKNENERDLLKSASFLGSPLIYRREAFNDVLPINQYNYHFVGEPLRTAPEMRTAISTFRPSTWPAYKPFKVFKLNEKMQLVLDEESTKSSFNAESIDTFKDSENQMHPKERFKADNVVVEKTGFQFKVVEPSARILKKYTSKDANSNSSQLRKPKVKVLVDWQ